MTQRWFAVGVLSTGFAFLSICSMLPLSFCLKELVLAGIFPFTGKSGWTGGIGCFPAVQLALEHVNDHPHLLPGYQLTMRYNDSECDPEKGMAIFSDLIYNKPQKIMVLGPGCSAVTETVAEAAKMWNLVVMSYGSTSPALSDRRKYKTFFRTVPSAGFHNPAYIRLLKHYGWQKIHIIYEAEKGFNSIVGNLEKLCEQNEIEVVTRQSFLYDPTEAVRNLNRSDGGIIVGLFYETSARLVFCEAYKNNLYGNRSIWLIDGSFANNWFKVDPGVTCTKDELQEALEGHLTLEPFNKNSPGVSTISGLADNRAVFQSAGTSDDHKVTGKSELRGSHSGVRCCLGYCTSSDQVHSSASRIWKATGRFYVFGRIHITGHL
ncbi:gamma-aminobutyric acid type B receptor subunit 1-like isoform X2 [Paramacrobiotus metropolitanus]|uniref:gamma-aminobutyric acid type B receptor subunit 1-like isoform X2 n=1 Tax=Paramacrobiotus metropolitanus TaxID=2943436 RepID=UPI002446280C|nr:gamma-aminobutyric acid type B receptor subunit 1-like isoform X2 [Paramacrobiotus metropolitanus]